MENKKAKFTVIDAVIILIVLAIMAVGVKMLLPKFMNTGDKEKISFTVMVQKEDENFAEAIKPGDKVTVSLTEKDGGVVKDVKAEPAKTTAFNSIDGNYAEQVIDGKEDVFVTIESEVTANDLAIKTGGTPIKVGAEVPVRGKGYASMGYVIAIND